MKTQLIYLLTFAYSLLAVALICYAGLAWT